MKRDDTAPEQATNEEDIIHLPSLLADEFGISRSQARLEVSLGQVTVDDVEVAKQLDFSKSELAGKTIEIKGESRSFKFEVEE